MKRVKRVRAVVVLFLSWQVAAPLHAQLYAGVLGEISTLSGDSRSVISPSSAAFSSYDPRNGGAVEILVGDVKLGKDWALRYTFSETLSKNPIDDRWIGCRRPGSTD